MKLLYITQNRPGVSSTSWGPGALVERIASAMARRGHDVRVLATSNNRAVSSRDGVVCHEFDPGALPPEAEKPYRDGLLGMEAYPSKADALSYRFWYELTRIISEGFIPDLVESVAEDGIGYYYAHHRLLGYPEAAAPLVTHCQTPGFISRRADREPGFLTTNFFRSRLERRQICSSDAVAAISWPLAERISRELHAPAPEVFLPTIDSGAESVAWPETVGNHLLFLGNFRHSSGIFSLLKVCRYLWDEGRDFSLTAAGPDAPHPIYGTSGIDHVRKAYDPFIRSGKLHIIPHEIPVPEIRRLCSETKALISPALCEAPPYAFLEAMACARPVIASRVGLQGTIVDHGTSGFVYDDEIGLEECIKRVLGATQEELSSWGTAARERVVRLLEEDRSIERRESWYREIIDRCRTTSRTLYPNAAFLDKTRFPELPRPKPFRESHSTVPGLLSVVIPCYNLGAFLKEALGSVVAATYRPLEIIVIDDASTDPLTRGVLGEIEQSHVQSDHCSLLVMRLARNLGISGVRNLGIRSVHGEFVCFLDADDRVDASYFSKAVQIVNRYPNIGFVTSWAELFGEASGTVVVPDFDFPYSLLWNTAFAPSVCRYEAFAEQRLDDSMEDYESFLHTVSAGWAGAHIPEALFSYRKRKESLFSLVTGHEILVSVERLVSLHPEMYRLFGEELFLLTHQNYVAGFDEFARRRRAWEASPFFRSFLRVEAETGRLMQFVTFFRALAGEFVPRPIKARIMKLFRPRTGSPSSAKIAKEEPR